MVTRIWPTPTHLRPTCPTSLGSGPLCWGLGVFVTECDDMLKFARQFNTCHLLCSLRPFQAQSFLRFFWERQDCDAQTYHFHYKYSTREGCNAPEGGWGGRAHWVGGISHEFMTFWFAWNLLLARMRPPQSKLMGLPRRHWSKKVLKEIKYITNLYKLLV